MTEKERKICLWEAICRCDCNSCFVKNYCEKKINTKTQSSVSPLILKARELAAVAKIEEEERAIDKEFDELRFSLCDF